MFPLGRPARLGGGPQGERPWTGGAIYRVMSSPKHPACHYAVTVISRGGGRSSVAAAAYRAGARLVDERAGRAHDYRRRDDVLSSEVIGWPGDLASLWTAAEAAERRRDARTAREARIALPAELPLDDQIRLTRGYALWLRDTYRVACHAAIHEPRWHDQALRTRLRSDTSEAGRAAYLAAMADPQHTNRNVHLHLAWTAREVNRAAGTLGAKTTIFDRRDTGGTEIGRIRAEWEKRVNAALAKLEIADEARRRVDLRSYQDQAEAGGAPEGLTTQPHLGPKWSALSRKLTTKEGVDLSRVGRRRARRRRDNDAIWGLWQERARLRALARERDSARIAAEREAERRERAAAERAALAAARTDEERAAAAEASANLTAPLRGDDALLQAIAAAQAAGDGGAGDEAWDAAQAGVRGPHDAGGPPIDYDAEIDPETVTGTVIWRGSGGATWRR